MPDAVTAERTFQGAWRITGSDANGYLVSRQYFGYTKREAQRMFRAELRTERNLR